MDAKRLNETGATGSSHVFSNKLNHPKLKWNRSEFPTICLLNQ